MDPVPVSNLLLAIGDFFFLLQRFKSKNMDYEGRQNAE